MKIFTFLKLFLITTFFGISILGSAQNTAGTLTFSVTVTIPSGSWVWRPKHFVAVWLENSSGTFIKTKAKYGNTSGPYFHYMNTWISKSGSNVVDAITGATKSTTSETITVSWNGTDISSSVVADGTYKVWIQMAYLNQNGATTSCSFVKGTTAISNQTYSNSGNFSNMTLSWTPSTTGITETILPEQNILVSPNPFSTETKIEYFVENEDFAHMAIYDIQGKEVQLLENSTLIPGNYSVAWNGRDSKGKQVPSGIYFCRYAAGDKFTVKKIIKL